jgi:hypothetical protein
MFALSALVSMWQLRQVPLLLAALLGDAALDVADMLTGERWSCACVGARVLRRRWSVSCLLAYANLRWSACGSCDAAQAPLPALTPLHLA